MPVHPAVQGDASACVTGAKRAAGVGPLHVLHASDYSGRGGGAQGRPCLRVAIRAARLYVLQATTVLAAIILPWIGLLLNVLPNGPLRGLDTTSLGFTLSAILIMTAFSRLRFLDLVPKARAALVERMSDGFLVLDIQDRIIDINATAARLLNLDSAVEFSHGLCPDCMDRPYPEPEAPPLSS